MKKIYLAGPDVFYREVFDIARNKKEIIDELSKGTMVGLHPFDKELIEAQTPLDKGRMISKANRSMMDDADIMIANITPFRGANIDDGTAFEIGYMMAQGKMIYAYSNAGNSLYKGNVTNWIDSMKVGGINEPDDQGYIRDHNGASVEQFGFPCNLMIGEIIEGHFAMTQTPQPPTNLSAFKQVCEMIVSNEGRCP